MTLRELNQVFDEFDLCNALVANLGSLSAKLLDVDADAVKYLTVSARKVALAEHQKPVMVAVRGAMQSLHHAHESIRYIGLTLDYLFIDGYRYEQILRLFAANTGLIPAICLLLGSHEKLD